MADAQARALFLKDGLTKTLIIKYTINGQTLTIPTDKIYSEKFEWTESICSEKELRFGGCEASVIKFTVSRDIPVLKELWINVSFNISDGQTTKNVIIGNYLVDEDVLAANRRERNITAYDDMYAVNNRDVAEWYNGLTFPITIKNLRDSLFSYLEFSQESDAILINDNYYVYSTGFKDSLMAGNVLKDICALNCCFGKIEFTDDEFAIPYVKYLMLEKEISTADTSNAYIISGSYYRDMTFSDFYTSKINNLTITQSATDDMYTAFSNIANENKYSMNLECLNIFNDLGQNAEYIAGNILREITHIQYMPATITAMGNPAVGCGQWVRLEPGTKEADQTIVNTYILSRTMTGIQSLKDKYKAEGVKEYEKDWSAGDKTAAQEAAREEAKIAVFTKLPCEVPELSAGTLVVELNDITVQAATEPDDGMVGTNNTFNLYDVKSSFYYQPNVAYAHQSGAAQYMIDGYSEAAQGMTEIIIPTKLRDGEGVTASVRTGKFDYSTSMPINAISVSGEESDSATGRYGDNVEIFKGLKKCEKMTIPYRASGIAIYSLGDCPLLKTLDVQAELIGAAGNFGTGCPNLDTVYFRKPSENPAYWDGLIEHSNISNIYFDNGVFASHNPSGFNIFTQSDKINIYANDIDFIGVKDGITPSAATGDWYVGNGDMDEITLPISVKYIYPYAFGGCTSIKSLTITNENAEFVNMQSGYIPAFLKYDGSGGLCDYPETVYVSASGVSSPAAGVLASFGCQIVVIDGNEFVKRFSPGYMLAETPGSGSDYSAGDGIRISDYIISAYNVGWDELSETLQARINMGGGAVYTSGNGVTVDNVNYTISADTTVLATIQMLNAHKNASTLDHPNNSVTWEKLSTDVQNRIGQGGGGSVYTAGDGIDITNYVVSVDDNGITWGMLATAVQNRIDAGGGTIYTAGDGITIDEDEISVDTTYVATLSALSALNSSLQNAMVQLSESISSALALHKNTATIDHPDHSVTWDKLATAVQNRIDAGGTAYTAGDGIDITNNVISLLDNAISWSKLAAATKTRIDRGDITVITSSMTAYDVTGSIVTVTCDTNPSQSSGNYYVFADNCNIIDYFSSAAGDVFSSCTIGGIEIISEIMNASETSGSALETLLTTLTSGSTLIRYFSGAWRTNGDTLLSRITTIENTVGIDKVGDLSNLTTTAKTNAVAAINEVDADVAALSTAVGNANAVLAQLLTTGV